jgi:hypothetical protein
MEQKIENSSPLQALTGILIFTATFIFINAYRELILAKSMMIFIVIILAFSIFSSLFGILFLKRFDSRKVTAVGLFIMLFGYLLWIFPEFPIKVAGTSIGLASASLVEIYPLFLISSFCMWVPFGTVLLGLFQLSHEWKVYLMKFHAEYMIPIAIVFAFILNQVFRLMELTLITPVQLAIVLVGVITWTIWVKNTQNIYRDYRKIEPDMELIRRQKSFFQGAGILGLVPLGLSLFMLYLNPEILAYSAGVPYNIMVLLLITTGFLALGIGILLWNTYIMGILRRNSLSKLFLVLSLLVTGLFGSYFFFPPGHPLYLLIFLGGFGFIILQVIFVIGDFLHDQFKFKTGWVGITLFLLIGAIVGLRVLLIERHVPYLWYIIFGFMTIGNLIWWYRTKSTNIPKSTESNLKNALVQSITTIWNRGEAIGLILIICVSLIGSSITIGSQAPVTHEKSVWASLYTWYGVPSGPAGKYGLPQFDGSEGNWTSVGSIQSSPQIVNGRTYFIGTATSNGDSLKLETSLKNAFILGDRTYLECNISVGNPSLGPVIMEIRRADLVFQTELLNTSVTANQYYRVNKVFPLERYFTNVSVPAAETITNGSQFISIHQVVTTGGAVNLSIAYLEVSRWKHYNEDYHTVESTEKPGFWRNDPPVFKATAHSAFYNQSTGPWPEIETYGYYDHSKWNEVPLEEAYQYGLYDSLDPIVIRSQLRLMEKAGLDVVQIMHPWGMDVIQLIFDIAIEINSNLTFFLYWSNDLPLVAKVMEQFANHPIYSKYYYRINGNPVFNYGFTGEPNEIPFPALAAHIAELRRYYNIHLIADGFSSPYSFREEFLTIFDGWYYYDTSAFYRHGWGDPAIDNFQADGKLLPLNAWNHLDRLFGGLAKAVQSHGKTYCAIVIPGTDNTVVHDFKGSPLYDGRTGTINSRANGLCFNRTWEATIASGADHACIVSWNELHEGTEIEPTFENGTFYVELNAIWAENFRKS